MKHLFDHLDEVFNEYFHGRSEAMTNCGGLPKEKAEALAKAETESYRLHREKVAKDSAVQK